MATQKEIAEHLDLETVRVRILIKKGVLPPSKGRGGYNYDACRVAYIRYLRGLSSKQVRPADDGGSENGKNYSDLLEQEKFRKAKRENDLEEGLVAPVETLIAALTSVGSIAATELDALPMEMKRNWPTITGDQIMIIKKTIAKIRNSIADMEIEVENGNNNQ